MAELDGIIVAENLTDSLTVPIRPSGYYQRPTTGQMLDQDWSLRINKAAT
jgi:hypothetical protein